MPRVSSAFTWAKTPPNEKTISWATWWSRLKIRISDVIQAEKGNSQAGNSGNKARKRRGRSSGSQRQRQTGKGQTRERRQWRRAYSGRDCGRAGGAAAFCAGQD